MATQGAGGSAVHHGGKFGVELEIQHQPAIVIFEAAEIAHTVLSVPLLGKDGFGMVFDGKIGEVEGLKWQARLAEGLDRMMGRVLRVRRLED